MRLLIITEEIRSKIKAAVVEAQKRPIPMDKVRDQSMGLVRVGSDEAMHTLKLSDRQPGWKRAYKSQQVLIPMGYRASFSIEEQPAGMTKHLSVSVDEGKEGRMPNPQAVEMIAQEFGIKEWHQVWNEEFAPGCFAINILEITEREEGHA